jgi:DNA-directed RNA polymerase specialized sigma subunit
MLFPLLEAQSVSFTFNSVSVRDCRAGGDSSMDDASQSDFTALADAIADLPERERLVFTLYY